MSIEFRENAVCYAGGKQWFNFEGTKGLDLINVNSYSGDTNDIIYAGDFQLNEPSIGDYIEKSELDTEQKYNDAVEVLNLYGVTGGLINRSYQVASALNDGNDERFVIHKTGDGELCFGVVPSDSSDFCKRKLTYNQLMAIGKLKRMMLEREKSAPETTADLAADNSDQVKNPKHYQLIEGVESIEIIARSMTKEQWKGFCLGNMLKYRLRCGKKHSKVDFEDIEKANYYEVLYEKYKGFCCADKRI